MSPSRAERIGRPIASEVPFAATPLAEHDDLDGFAAAPSAHQKEKLAELTPLVNDASAQVKKISDEELPALNKKMNDAGIPHIVPAPPSLRGARGSEEEFDR